MSKKIVLFCLLLMCLPVISYANQIEPPAYLSSRTYQGIYKAQRLYQINPKTSVWNAYRKPSEWKTLPCWEAQHALSSKGIWTGNLTENGECVPGGEAPTYASGNYLNYLLETSSSQAKPAGPDND